MTATTQIKDLEAAVKTARENEDRCRNDHSAATSAARQAEIALVQARAECLGFRVGSLVTTVYGEKTVHGVVVGYFFEYGTATVQVAPLTKTGKPHATCRHASFWVNARGCFSDGLRLETEFDKANIAR